MNDIRQSAALAVDKSVNRPRGHGAIVRGLDSVARQPEGFGRFGRMFPELAPARYGKTLADDQVVMRDVAATMINPEADIASITTAEPIDENVSIPAGYTYFGQFVDHDLTFDTGSSLDRETDPSAVEDFRTPRLDLDSVYGRGPDDQPYLYNDDLTLKLGRNIAADGVAQRFDLPRAPMDQSRKTGGCERALIGDKRNDENILVAQIHGLFLQLHNKLMKQAVAGGAQPEEVFSHVRRRVRWHYQWVVIHDFLRRIVGEETHAAVWNDGDIDLRFFDPRSAAYPFMPVEFSVAAYRLGHSMVRPAYQLNRFLSGVLSGDRFPIFKPTAACDDLTSLNGFRPIPDQWGLDWDFFFDLGAGRPEPGEPQIPQPSYRLDSLLVLPLKDLPDHQREQDVARRSLAALNLLRSLVLGLPSGQAVARRMGIVPLSDEQLWVATGNLQGDGAMASLRQARADLLEKHRSLKNNAPLWYYVLREAEILATEQVNDGNGVLTVGGVHLGPVGGRIVAETILGLLACDDQSFLVQHPLWQPEIPVRDAQWGFQISDIIAFNDAP